MEALVAASVAGLTVYDMCKAVSKDIVVSDIRLEMKTGVNLGIMSGRTDLLTSHYYVGFSASILLLATQIVLVAVARWM